MLMFSNQEVICNRYRTWPASCCLWYEWHFIYHVSPV